MACSRNYRRIFWSRNNQVCTNFLLQVIFNNFKDYFPIGPIGRIPAFDADVSDKLRYRILAGNNANLIHLNESTGYLTLSPQLNTNVQKTAIIDVSVTGD